MKPRHEHWPKQHETELNRRARAREVWTESEWVLECLRAKTGTPLIDLADEEIVEWHQKIGQ